MKTKFSLFAAMIMAALVFSGCHFKVTPEEPDNPPKQQLEIVNARSASVSDSGSATVILAWQANGTVVLGCKEKAGNLKEEITLSEDTNRFVATGLNSSTEYTFYWKDSEGEVKTELKVVTPVAGKVQLNEEEKETLFRERLSKYLTEEKKVEIFNEILKEKRDDGTFLALLTEEEIESLQNNILTDDEKLEIFEEVYAEKRTSVWIISQLTDAEMELIIGSLTAEDLKLLLEEMDKIPPAMATDFKAVIVGEKIRLSWNDAADEDVLCYEIKYSKSAAVRSVSFDSESIIVPQGKGYAYLNDLEDDTKYSFEIRTVDTTGNKSGKAQVECTVWKQTAESVMDISNSYYNGVLLYISEEAIPEDANVRYIFVNEKLVAQTDFNEPKADRYKENEWGYPYVKKGNTYTFKIQYLKNGKVLKEMQIEVKAKSGLGELNIVKQPVWKYENYSVIFSQQPEVTINENALTSSSAYAVAQPYTTEDHVYFDAISFTELSFETIDVAGELRNVKPEGKLSLNLRYVFPSSKYGDYRLDLFDSSEDYFTVDWNNLNDESVGISLEYDLTDYLTPDIMFVLLYLNGFPVMEVSDIKGTIDYPYVEAGKNYKVEFRGQTYSGEAVLGEPINISPKKGLVTVNRQGEFTIENDTGVLKVTKEPEITVAGQTFETGYLYGFFISYEDDSVSINGENAFTGYEFDLADFILKGGLNPAVGNATIKIKLLAALNMGTDRDPVYCLLPFITDENPDGLFDVNLNWSQIKKPIEIITGEDVNGIKVQIKPSVIPEKATDIKVSLGDNIYDFFPVSQNEIEITNVLPGNTYDLVVSFGQKTYFTESFWVYFTDKEYSLTVTPETGNVSCEGGSYSVNNGILSFTKPVLRLNGDEKTDIYYYLKLEYKDIFSGEYKHDSDLDISSLREGNTYLLEKAYDKYSEDNITDFRFTIEIRKENINDEVPFAAIMAKDIPFTVDWSQMPDPYEILSDGSSGIKIKINEDFFSEEYEGYNFYIDDFQIIGYKSDNLITYPDVLPGANYNLKIGLFFGNGKWSYYYPEYTPSTGNVSLESPAEFQMDNGVLTLVTPPVIKRLGEEIQDVKYTVVYKMKSLDGQYDSSVNNLSLGRGNRINIFRDSFDSYKNNTIGYAYKVYAYSDDSSAPYIVPLMEDFVEESVDWDNVERPYKIITAAGEPGVKVKINQYEIPEGAEYIESALNSNFVMVQKVTEGDNIVYYPYVYVSDRYSFSISFSDKDGHLLGNTIYLNSNSFIPYEYTVSPSGAVSLEGNILKVTENPGIDLPDSEEDLFNLDEFVYEWKDTEGANHGGYLSKDQNGDSYWIFDEEKISSISKLTVFAIFTQKINDKEYVSIKVPFAVINK